MLCSHQSVDLCTNIHFQINISCISCSHDKWSLHSDYCVNLTLRFSFSPLGVGQYTGWVTPLWFTPIMKMKTISIMKMIDIHCTILDILLWIWWCTEGGIFKGSSTCTIKKIKKPQTNTCTSTCHVGNQYNVLLILWTIVVCISFLCNQIRANHFSVSYKLSMLKSKQN